MCRPYLTFYPPLDIYPNNIVTNSLIHPQFPLNLWKDDNLLLMKKGKCALLIQTVLLDIISTNLV